MRLFWRDMIRILWTTMLMTGVFTFLTILIAVIRALTSFEITSETEKKMTGLCGINMLIAGLCWCMSFVLGVIVLFVRIWG